MLRFIDISRGGVPMAAFIHDHEDRFVENSHGHHSFICMLEVRDSSMVDILEPLVPKHFFDRNSK